MEEDAETADHEVKAVDVNSNGTRHLHHIGKLLVHTWLAKLSLGYRRLAGICTYSISLNRFYPGILFTSLSLGMIIAPKIEIYTELICRSIDPAKSGVNLPPPVSAFPGIGGDRHRGDNPIVLPPSLPNENRTNWPSEEPENGVQATFNENYAVVTLVNPDPYTMSSFDAPAAVDRRDDTWAKQCRGSAVVQKEVIRLVSSFFRRPT